MDSDFQLKNRLSFYKDDFYLFETDDYFYPNFLSFNKIASFKIKTGKSLI